MKKFLLLLSGIILIGLLSLICFANKVDAIKSYFVNKTKSELSKESMYSVDVDLRGKGFSTELWTVLSGVVTDDSIKKKAVESASKVDGIFGVDDKITVVKPKVVKKKIVREEVKIDTKEIEKNKKIAKCQNDLNEILSKSKIHFASSKAVVKEESYVVLKDISDVIKECKEVAKSIMIEGHTDSSGNSKKNMELSLQRAKAVKKLLVDRYFVDSQMLKVSGFGDSVPIADNNTTEGRAKNRRIEFKIDDEGDE